MSENILSEEMNRRKFLLLCGLGVAPGLLISCQSGAVQSMTETAQATANPPSESDWSSLAKSLQGTLIRPNSPQYTTAHQLFNPRFDTIHPAAVAYCASPQDVQTCLAFVRRFALPCTARCGGHSYAGYSTTSGLVLDVTRMSTITVDEGAGTATVGAGARLIDIYSTLAQHNVVIPAGSCPSVGIAGQTLGGGIGVIGRKFGLTCDNLLSAQVVAADGRLLTCDAQHEPDLFWALRGAGGGNFGVVTSFTFQTHPVNTLSPFTLNWPWSSAAAVVAAWQAWAPQAPDELWSNCLLLAPKDKGSDPVIRVNGVYVGDTASLEGLLQQLVARVETPPTTRYVSSASLLDTMLLEAGCYGKSVEACHLPTQNAQGQVQRDTAGAKSDYFTKPLPRPAIDAMVNVIARRHASSSLGEGGIGLDAYGGAINRVAADATAFVHRDALFSAQYSASWNANDPDTIVSANQSWLSDTWQAMRSYASGFAYQNYIDPDLTDWQHAYYGNNLDRLQHVKATYDPKNLFNFKQSIPPTGNA